MSTASENNNNNTVLISGAGPVGCLAACFMAQRGYQVEVFESRSDSRLATSLVQGRSINMALSNRAFESLNKISPTLVEDIHGHGLKMYGRHVHLKDGSQSFQPYGKEDQYILSVGRRFLNELLLTHAESLPNVRVHFDQKSLDVDLSAPSLTTAVAPHNREKRENSGELPATTTATHRGKFIVGADGLHSAVRQKMQGFGGARMDYHQHFVSHSYKELVLPASATGDFVVRSDALHIWPRHDFMLIALPNPTKDFTVTLFLREKTDLSRSPYSFEALDSDEKILDFFRKEFPDFLDLCPNVLETWHENPKCPLMWLKCNPHHYKDKAVLLGDAAHAIIPFYGQGVNCGFEDCKVLNQMFDLYGDSQLSQVFEEYSKVRKPSTDAICELSEHNFIEMSSSTAKTSHVLKKKFGMFLHKLFPSRFLPLYTMVTFTPEMTYAEAWSTYKKREKRISSLADAVLGVGMTAGVLFAADYALKRYFNLNVCQEIKAKWNRD